MLDKQIIKSGAITVQEGHISVEGYEVKDASCREVAAVALLDAIGILQRELQAIVYVPGGTGKCVID